MRPLLRIELRLIRLASAAAIMAGGLLLLGRAVDACPFCAGVQLTLTEEIDSSDVAVIAKLLTPADPARNPTQLNKARFEVVDLLKGDVAFAPGKKLEAFYFGNTQPGSLMLITGIDPSAVNWNTPTPINPRVQDYLKKALSLPKEGVERLVYFQDFLEDADEILAKDAYDEFGKAPYAQVKELKSQMHHDQLASWAVDPKIITTRRRLYLTMLGICGRKQDVERLEEVIRSENRSTMAGLDAVIAAYLTLKGPEGMPLVEETFFKNKERDYTELYQAIMALRFHGQEEQIIPRERLVEAFRLLLDRPEYADLVIPDLARWQDWKSIDALVELFKQDEKGQARISVINYLQVCPLPEARQRLAELAAIDPDAMRKATTLFPPVGAITRDQANSEEDNIAAANGDDATVAVADAANVPPPAGDPADPEIASESEQSDAVDAAPARPTASRTPAPGVRLSAAAPPPGEPDGPREVSHVLAWMALAGGVLGVSFWGILGAGRKTA